MTQKLSLSDLESNPAAKFNEIGDRVAGRIVAMDERQQTDLRNKPRTFDDGNPMMQWVFTVQTDNGDNLCLYAKGGRYTAEVGSGQSMLGAITQAVRDAGAADIEVGAGLSVAFTGRGTKKPGYDAPKLYTATYTAPKPPSVPVDELFSE